MRGFRLRGFEGPSVHSRYIGRVQQHDDGIGDSDGDGDTDDD